ncbi:MAG: hypothetical protein ACI9OU_001792, partial [Candidatus Promineifilaceae bacterium]
DVSDIDTIYASKKKGASPYPHHLKDSVLHPRYIHVESRARRFRKKSQKSFTDGLSLLGFPGH